MPYLIMMKKSGAGLPVTWIEHTISGSAAQPYVYGYDFYIDGDVTSSFLSGASIAHYVILKDGIGGIITLNAHIYQEDLLYTGAFPGIYYDGINDRTVIPTDLQASLGAITISVGAFDPDYEPPQSF